MSNVPRTGAVLHLVQPAARDRFPSAFEPGAIVTFTNRDPQMLDGVSAVSPVVAQISWDAWSDLGRPDIISVAWTAGAHALPVD